MRYQLTAWIVISFLFFIALTAEAQNEIEMPDNMRGTPEGGDVENSGDLATINSNNGDTVVNQGAGSGRPLPANSAIAPSLMGMNNQSCLKSYTGGVQLIGMGVSGGSWMVDEGCSLRLMSRELAALGLKVPAVATLCLNSQVYRAMLTAGLVCPVSSGGRLLVGRAALAHIKKAPEIFIPDFEENRTFYEALLAGSTSNEDEAVSGSLSDRYRTTKQSGADRRPNTDESVD